MVADTHPEAARRWATRLPDSAAVLAEISLAASGKRTAALVITSQLADEERTPAPTPESQASGVK